MRILLVEDDENFSRLLAERLKRDGFAVDTCMDGADAMYYIEEGTYDLFLLDRMLPHMDGLSILKQIRLKQIETPVIILTALGEVDDKIDGLDCGADDYLVKPFAYEELAARIRSINRRPRKWVPTKALSFGDISYSPDSLLLSGSGKNCTLSKKEGALLEFFLRNPGQILPRPILLSHVWGPEGDVEEGNLDNYIHFLRRRLHTVSEHVTIKTIRSVGYQMEASF